MTGAADQRVPAVLPVLMYHSIPDTIPTANAGAIPASDGGADGLRVPLRELRDHVAVLQGDGFELTGLTEALEIGRREPGRRVAALTFDDGYADFAAAAQLLAERGCGATLYVPTAHVGGEGMIPAAGRLLTWEELAGLPPAIEIGSHSHTHRPLDVLPDAELRHQAVTSRAELADRLGAQATSFCYPHGYAGPRAAATLRAAGYTNACVIGRRLATPADDVFAVPRVQVRPGLTAEQLRALVRDGEPGWVPRAKALAQPGWRLVRATSLRVWGHELT